MSERMLKVKACEHKDTFTVLEYGEDAPGKSLDTIEQCKTCGAVIHDYRHNGGQKSPNYPIVYECPVVQPFLAVCQQLIEAERCEGEMHALVDHVIASPSSAPDILARAHKLRRRRFTPPST